MNEFLVSDLVQEPLPLLGRGPPVLLLIDEVIPFLLDLPEVVVQGQGLFLDGRDRDLVIEDSLARVQQIQLLVHPLQVLLVLEILVLQLKVPCQ